MWLYINLALISSYNVNFEVRSDSVWRKKRMATSNIGESVTSPSDVANVFAPGTDDDDAELAKLHADDDDDDEVRMTITAFSKDCCTGPSSTVALACAYVTWSYNAMRVHFCEECTVPILVYRSDLGLPIISVVNLRLPISF